MLNATDLRCDFLTDPLGIEDSTPLLSWALTGLANDGVQKTCRVLVASDPALLEPGRADYWDSGRLSSDRCQLRYAGAALPARARCWWTVHVTDDHGDLGESAQPAHFELGLPAEQWRAGWLGFGSGWAGQALLMRKTFTVEGTVMRARAYVVSVGWHQLRLNGAAVDNRVLEPAPTNISRRLLCSTYALDHALRPGTNALGLMLAGGWYGSPKIRVQLHVDYADGHEQVICSGFGKDLSWTVAPAPIVASSPYDGEIYDARLALPDWDHAEYAGGMPALVAGDDVDPWAVLFGLPGARERDWTMSQAADAPGGALHAPALPPATVTMENIAADITSPKPGTWIVDAGTNGAGWARLRISGASRGRRVTLRFAETLNADGLVNQENLKTARAADTYVCAGAPVEVFEPTFTSHGFRYVQIDGLEQAPKCSDVTIRRARTTCAARSRFTGEPLLESIYANVIRTEASNTLGLLSDCPQRAERHGWLNDLTNRLDTATLAQDIGPLLSKVLDDIADAQRADGAIPDTVPFRWGYEVADPVCLTPLLLPRLLQRHWGDERALARAYPIARGWMHYLEGLCEDGILRYTHWGDWAEPRIADALRGADENPEVPEAVSQRTPGALVSTACLAWGLRALSALAADLGDREESIRAWAGAETVSAAFRAVFRDPATGRYGTGSQGSLACALGLGLVPPAEVKQVVAELAAEVERCGYLTTGNVATKFVLETLSDHGRHDLALRLARRDEYPSWGYMVRRGATTLWERWEEATGGGMNSHNHGMLGAIGSWLITRHAGLALADEAVGSNRWLISVPRLEEDCGAGAEIDSPRGLAAVRWERRAGHLGVTVTVPQGASAVVRLPIPAGQIQDGHMWRETSDHGCEAVVGGGTWAFGGQSSPARTTG